MYKKVFIHVGLPKTASSYLQLCVFPCIGGCDYIRGTDPLRKFIWNVSSENLLLSHENFSGEPVKTTLEGPKGWSASRHHRLRILSTLWPDANIILVVRKHGEWLSSMYRQYLHQGGKFDFTEFFSTESDLLVEREGGEYKKLISNLKCYFTGGILVLNYEGLKKEPEEALELITSFMDLQFVEPIRQREINKSVKNSQARLLRFFNRFTEPTYDESRELVLFSPQSKGLMRSLGLTPVKLLRRRLRFLAHLGKDVISREQIDEANRYYQDDWEWILEHVGQTGNVF